MTRTYSNGKKIYSVDMMFAYINMFKPAAKNIPIKKLVKHLAYHGWGNPHKKGIKFSARDVIADPKKYKKHYARIKKADLTFPIIVHKNTVVDGVHRLAKSYTEKKDNIKIYDFDAKLMKKFLINDKGDWEFVDHLETHDYIELYCKRF